jgi:tetratricopeptide (TPR) repeat protein
VNQLHSFTGKPDFKRVIVWTWICLSPLASPGTRAQERVAAPEEEQLARGVEALKAGDLDAAEKVFKEALQHGTKLPLVYHNLGVISQQRGRHEEAARNFHEAIRLQPTYGPAHLLLGSSLTALGKNAEATSEFKRAVQLLPNEPLARLQLAKNYGLRNDWPAAVQEFLKLTQMAPENPEYAYQLGKAATRLSDWCYRKIGDSNPNSARLHQAAGEEYVLQGKWDLAIASYRKAVQADPKLPELHLALAELFFEQNQLDEALKEANLELALVQESKTALETKMKIESAMASGPR